MIFLPDYPATTQWLSEAEKVIAQGRLAADAGSEDVLGEENISIWRGIAQASMDIRVWLFACLQMATTASISYSHFFPTLIKQIGFKDNTKVLLLTSPPYLFAFVWALSFATVADRKQNRSISAGISAIVAMVGSILMITVLNNHWARYAFTFLVCAGTFGVYSTTYTWLSSTIPRPPVKRAAAIGIANSCANLASLFANYFWLDEYAPNFRVSWGCTLAFQALAFSSIVALRLVLRRGNKRFEQAIRETDPDDTAAMAQLDEDSQRAVLNGFRYIT
jgi:MFS family permease